MNAAPSLGNPLREWYAEEAARIRADFLGRRSGRDALSQRTALVDALCLRLWQEIAAAEPTGPRHLALVALGGFGRRQLFPFSDIDVLFLYEDGGAEREFQPRVRQFSQELWDLHLRFSPAGRTLAECDRADPANVEFSTSLLDARYLAGDRELFAQLQDQLVPRLVMREYQPLVQQLTEVTRDRHRRFGQTVFHLEPNFKDGPGGLRDANVVLWLGLISALDRMRRRPERDLLLPAELREPFEAATQFLCDVRCFLHYRHGRDDNTLAWEAQDAAAAERIGAEVSEAQTPPEWMRCYFRHARTIHRLATQWLEEIPAARSSLYRQLQSWRSRVSNADFSVVNGMVFLQQAASVQDPDVLLRAFQFLAHHGLKLSTAAERSMQQVLPSLAATPPQGSALWNRLCEILYEPHAADALRAMHHLGLLTLLLPELRGIDALVVRDFYHRFTVDEHSFLAIESLHRLAGGASEWDKRFAELFNELERPELLFLALLLHDAGKGVPGDDHVRASLELAGPCVARLDLEPADGEAVLFLVGSHLEMSATMRRDVFDSESVRVFAEKMGTPDRLKMLCLLTYADIKAVNPDALTPWKADTIWQLYIAAANCLNRGVDEHRFRAGVDAQDLERFRTLAPALGKRLKTFLEGMPQRYLRTYGTAEVAKHVEMAGRLGQQAVQLELKRGRHWFELTLLTPDRPFLFARLSGAIAARGMNIVKANAFSNQAGTVVDTFYFTDPFRTLELNLPEWERFKRSVSDVLAGRADLDQMLADRARSHGRRPPRIKVQTRIEFDEQASSHSTLLQVITQDRPGLLHRISSCIARQKCNIEIALIDTEGEMAIDVFYVSLARAGLNRTQQERLRKVLQQELADPS